MEGGEELGSRREEWAAAFYESFDDIIHNYRCPTHEFDDKLLHWGKKLMGKFTCPRHGSWHSINGQVEGTYQLVPKKKMGKIRLKKLWGQWCAKCHDPPVEGDDSPEDFGIQEVPESDESDGEEDDAQETASIASSRSLGSNHHQPHSRRRRRRRLNLPPEERLLPEFTPEEKQRCMEHVADLVKRHYYGIEEQFISGLPQPVGRGNHNSRTCEACLGGRCRYNRSWRGFFTPAPGPSGPPPPSRPRMSQIFWKLYFGEEDEPFRSDYEHNYAMNQQRINNRAPNLFSSHVPPDWLSAAQQLPPPPVTHNMHFIQVDQQHQQQEGSSFQQPPPFFQQIPVSPHAVGRGNCRGRGSSVIDLFNQCR